VVLRTSIMMNKCIRKGKKRTDLCLQGLPCASSIRLEISGLLVRYSNPRGQMDKADVGGKLVDRLTACSRSWGREGKRGERQRATF
jgi:hypothetical protein